MTMSNEDRAAMRARARLVSSVYPEATQVANDLIDALDEHDDLKAKLGEGEAGQGRLQGQLDLRDKQAEADSDMYRANLRQYEAACAANFKAHMRGEFDQKVVETNDQLRAELVRVRGYAGHLFQEERKTTKYPERELAEARTALEAMTAENDAARRYLEGEGYRTCDTPACNCNSWHPHGGWYARFQEIEAVVEPSNGETLLAATTRQRQLTHRQDETRGKLDAAHKRIAALEKVVLRFQCGDQIESDYVTKMDDRHVVDLARIAALEAMVPCDDGCASITCSRCRYGVDDCECGRPHVERGCNCTRPQRLANAATGPEGDDG